MTRRLMAFDHRTSPYDRPNHKWLCGRLAEGAPCRIGPDGRGRCRATTECTPRRDGPRWRCARSQSAGGPCAEGPRPDGSCCRPIRRCVPVRSVRAKRGLAARWAAVVAVGFLVLALGGSRAERWLSPGALDAAHAGVTACASCHDGFEAGPAGWLRAAFGGIDAAGASRSCLGCHELGAQPLRPHSLPPARLQASSRKIKAHAGPRRFPLELAMAANTVAPRLGSTEPVACATCHREHQGAAGRLTAIDDGRCQACHSVRFAGFADGHPAFTDYPYGRRTRIFFDHVSHIDKHFPEEAAVAPERCAACHAPDDEGAMMLVRGFEGSCAACHRGDITGATAAGAKGIAVLAVPGLDLPTLREREAAIGAWPEFADGELGPFMALLLAGDPALREPLQRFRELDALDLRQASAADIDAVARVAWAVKGLFADVLADGTAALRERLTAALGRELDPEAANRLVGALPLETLRAAQAEWFPGLAAEVARHRSGETVPIPADELAGGETAEQDAASAAGEAAEGGDILGGDEPEGGDILGGDEPEGGDILGGDEPEGGDILGGEEPEGGDILGGDEPEGGDILGGDEPEGGDILGGDEPEGGDILGGDEPEGGDILGGDEPEGGDILGGDEPERGDEPAEGAPPPEPVAPEEWAAAGGWYRDYFALRYRPQGHSDPFLRAWLTVAAAAFGTPAEPRVAAVFERLADPNAPGKCVKCHSVDRTAGGGRAVNWQPARPEPRERPFTAFAHAPHMPAVGEAGCKTCHEIDRQAKYQAAFEGLEPASFAANFAPMDKATCTGCHVEAAAGADCQLCHRYHVGTFPPAVLQTSLTAHADNGEE